MNQQYKGKFSVLPRKVSKDYEDHIALGMDHRSSTVVR
jgi:hypothetical protein